MTVVNASCILLTSTSRCLNFNVTNLIIKNFFLLIFKLLLQLLKYALPSQVKLTVTESKLTYVIWLLSVVCSTRLTTE
jgi:hypothetical protein